MMRRGFMKVLATGAAVSAPLFAVAALSMTSAEMPAPQADLSTPSLVENFPRSPVAGTPPMVVGLTGETLPVFTLEEESKEKISLTALNPVLQLPTRTLANAPMTQVRRLREATDGCCEAGHLPSRSCALYFPGYSQRSKPSDTPGPRGRSDFVVAAPDWKWPQPGGLGTTVTITYSFSNLLDGRMRGISAANLRSAVREALSRWAAVAPLTFVEVADSGPTTIGDTSYAPGTTPNLRFGHHSIDGRYGVLAHAFYPFDTVNDGLSGDLHFDNTETWGITPSASSIDFLEVCLHEIGHALGLNHQEPPPVAIMNPFYGGRFTGLTSSFLFTDDQDGIIAIYGNRVTVPPEPPAGDSIVTVAYSVGSRTLTLTGDDQASGLTISKRGNNLVVQAGARTKLKEPGAKVTATRTSMTFSNVGSAAVNITGDLKGGSDVVSFLSLKGALFDLNLGAGADRATLNLCTVATLKLNGGEGTDALVTTTSRISQNQVTGFP